MNDEVFKYLMQTTFDSLKKLSSTKGVEYAGSEDRLANFKRLEKRLNLSQEKILLVYLTKHLDSIDTYVKNIGARNVSLSEPIEGRIDDAILYLILLKGIIQERGGIPKEADDTTRPTQLVFGFPKQ